jgi:hypothetical protein
MGPGWLSGAAIVTPTVNPAQLTSSPYDGRRPKPRPDVNRGEEPDRVFLAADDRPNLVGLKLREGKCNYFSTVEPTTRMGCLFEPSSDGIPGDLFYSLSAVVTGCSSTTTGRSGRYFSATMFSGALPDLFDLAG